MLGRDEYRLASAATPGATVNRLGSAVHSCRLRTCTDISVQRGPHHNGGKRKDPTHFMSTELVDLSLLSEV